MGYYIGLANYDVKLNRIEDLDKINEILNQYDAYDDWDIYTTIEDSLECIVQFNGEKLMHYELEMFGKIAPYIQKGSYLEIQGEDSRWRWYFDGKDAVEIYPEINWPIPD